MTVEIEQENEEELMDDRKKQKYMENEEDGMGHTIDYKHEQGQKKEVERNWSW